MIMGFSPYNSKDQLEPGLYWLAYERLDEDLEDDEDFIGVTLHRLKKSSSGNVWAAVGPESIDFMPGDVITHYAPLSKPDHPLEVTDDILDQANVDSAVERLLEDDFRIPTIYADKSYIRVQDDNDGDRSEINQLQIYIAQDADVHVILPRSFDSLRFRTSLGGGNSLRVRNALLLVAEAIRRDNIKRRR